MLKIDPAEKQRFLANLTSLHGESERVSHMQSSSRHCHCLTFCLSLLYLFSNSPQQFFQSVLSSTKDPRPGSQLVFHHALNLFFGMLGLEYQSLHSSQVDFFLPVPRDLVIFELIIALIFLGYILYGKYLLSSWNEHYSLNVFKKWVN